MAPTAVSTRLAADRAGLLRALDALHLADPCNFRRNNAQALQQGHSAANRAAFYLLCRRARLALFRLRPPDPRRGLCLVDPLLGGEGTNGPHLPRFTSPSCTAPWPVGGVILWMPAFWPRGAQ